MTCEVFIDFLNCSDTKITVKYVNLNCQFVKRFHIRFVLVFGSLCIISGSLILSLYDDRNTTKRLCFHYSMTDIEILQDYKVKIKQYLKNKKPQEITMIRMIEEIEGKY